MAVENKNNYGLNLVGYITIGLVTGAQGMLNAGEGFIKRDSTLFFLGTSELIAAFFCITENGKFLTEMPKVENQLKNE